MYLFFIEKNPSLRRQSFLLVLTKKNYVIIASRGENDLLRNSNEYFQIIKQAKRYENKTNLRKTIRN